jgi:hypothetical protein
VGLAAAGAGDCRSGDRPDRLHPATLDQQLRRDRCCDGSRRCRCGQARPRIPSPPRPPRPPACESPLAGADTLPGDAAGHHPDFIPRRLSGRRRRRAPRRGGLFENCRVRCSRIVGELEASTKRREGRGP